MYPYLFMEAQVVIYFIYPVFTNTSSQNNLTPKITLSQIVFGVHQLYRDWVYVILNMD
jgi:hypothetical protein